MGLFKNVSKSLAIELLTYVHNAHNVVTFRNSIYNPVP